MITVKNVKGKKDDITLTLIASLHVGDELYSEDIMFKTFVLKFKVIRHEDSHNYECLLKKKTQCEETGVYNLILSCDEFFFCISPSTSYQQIFYEKNTGSTINISIIAYIAYICTAPTPSQSTFKTMYDDETLVDFKITVKSSSEGSREESVGFHRLILAMWSPVMKNMFNNSWKEKNEGVLELPIKLDVINAFKKYVYTNELPEDRETLLSLVELGSYFMDPKLETGAIDVIVEITEKKDILETFTHAFQNRLHLLSEKMLLKLKNTDFDVLKESLAKMLIEK